MFQRLSLIPVDLIVDSGLQKPVAGGLSRELRHEVFRGSSVLITAFLIITQSTGCGSPELESIRPGFADCYLIADSIRMSTWAVDSKLSA